MGKEIITYDTWGENQNTWGNDNRIWGFVITIINKASGIVNGVNQTAEDIYNRIKDRFITLYFTYDSITKSYQKKVQANPKVKVNNIIIKENDTKPITVKFENVHLKS